jgi:hypothetical protein
MLSAFKPKEIQILSEPVLYIWDTGIVPVSRNVCRQILIMLLIVTRFYYRQEQGSVDFSIL